jgi:hypothetical protein
VKRADTFRSAYRPEILILSLTYFVVIQGDNGTDASGRGLVGCDSV